MGDVLCRVVDLPHKINAVTVVDSNGDFNVYVNAKLSKSTQLKAYRHECEHIKCEHFYSDRSVESCETEANDA